MNPFAFLPLQTLAASLALETQTVMVLRIMGMSGVMPAAHDENFVMFAEKGPAMARSANAAAEAAMRGLPPEQIMRAALEPLADKVHENRVRLMK